MNATPAACRETVARVAEQECAALATGFYDGMLGHPTAAKFLNHETVHKRLHGSMQRWIKEIYADPQTSPAAIVAHQRHVGEVHARIQLPIHLVARGARQLKHALFDRLATAFADPQALRIALAYTGQLMDLALELMTEAYMSNSQRGARTDEAYRLFSLGQNMSTERERQRSAVLEWGQEVLFTLHRPARPVVLPSLGTSEFGLWFNHKAAAMFEGASELSQIVEIMRRVDDTVLPRLSVTAPQDDTTETLIRELQEELESLKYHLNTLFERQLEVENARDSLTRLLNRRFLPPVMNREIHLSNTRQHGFALLLIDVDHFKRINDEHGHDAGDLVLQQASTLIMDCVRNGDFVFRYGGEELLVILVEISHDVALRIAEAIRHRFEQQEFMIGQGRHLHATVSIGLAMYDGHPDPKYHIKRADEAMYEAKQTGRNRVCEAVG